MQIHAAGFEIKYTDQLIEAMCEGIEEKKAAGILDCIGTMSWESKKIEQLYKLYIGKLQKIYNQSLEKKSGDDLSSFLEEKNWAQKIYNYCFAAKHPKNPEDYTKKMSPFLKALDVDVLIEKLDNSNGENLQKFIAVLRLVYPSESRPAAFFDENEERKRVYNAVKKLRESETQKIRKFQYQTIEEHLSKFIIGEDQTECE